MVAEIIDIRRFASDDKLASYSGLGKVENKTAEGQKMKKAGKYNRRLRDLFMTAAMNVVQFDPTSHVAGYHRALRKQGMDATEATRRVARSLVRVIYREFRALVADERPMPSPQGQQEGPSGVASDQGRGDKRHPSNTPARSPKLSRARRGQRVKGSSAEAQKREEPERRAQPARRGGPRSGSQKGLDIPKGTSNPMFSNPMLCSRSF